MIKNIMPFLSKFGIKKIGFNFKIILPSFYTANKSKKKEGAKNGLRKKSR